MIPVSYERKFIILVVAWFAVSLSTPVTHAMGYDSYGFFLRLFIIAATLFVCLLFDTYPLLLVVLPAITALAALVTYAINSSIIFQLLEQASTLFYTSANLWFAGTIVIITIIFFIILAKLKGNLLLLFLFGLFIMVPLWYLYVDAAYAGAVSYLLCWLLLLSYQSGRRIWSRLPGEEQADLRSGWLRYTYWILAFMIIFGTLLPKSIPPVPWTGLQVWVDETLPLLAELRGGDPKIVRGFGEEFGVAIAGFGRSGQLGGPLLLDPTILLEVKASGPLYLRGSVAKTYTGNSWSLGAERNEWTAVVPEEVLQPYLRKVRVDISHVRLKTSTVFTIPYTTEIRRLTQKLQQTEGGGAVSDSQVELGQEYFVYGSTFAYRADFSALEAGTIPEDFAAWLALPENLPARVRELAQDVTRDTESYYGKMKALETYLRESYRYSESPSTPLRTKDFVDFFLFDEKKGYCTSFASALTVMGRSVGVPTRYVQGFKLPAQTDADTTVRVPGTMAHAWTEAYIPGLGWLIFEATPGFDTLDTLPLKSEEPAPLPQQPDPDPAEISGGPDYMVLILRALALILVLLITITAILVTVMLILRRATMSKNFRQMMLQTDRIQAAFYYNLTLAFLASIEIGKTPGETPLEYARRINRLVSNWKLDFQKISAGINTSLYSSNQDTSALLVEQTKAFSEIIFKRYLVQKGKLKAFYEIYFLQKYMANDFFRQFMR